MSGPSLRRRIWIALVGTVAATCIGLTAGAGWWVDSQYRSQLADAIVPELGAAAAAIDEATVAAPAARNWEELEGHLPSSGEGGAITAGYVIIPINAWDQSIEPSQGSQSTSGEVPVMSGRQECLLAKRLSSLSGHDPGAGGYELWTEDCSGQVMGYAVVDAPDGAAVAGWLVVRAVTRDAGDDPIPALVLAFSLGSVIAIAAAAIVAGAVARTVTRPLTLAGAMAESVASGDFGLRIPVKGSDEVARMSSAVNTMADRLTGQIAELEAANRSQRRFVADVAHELRTPTAALLASAEALSKAETRDEAAAQVAPQLRRLAGLTEDLLEISAMDAGRAMVALSRINLDDLAREVVADSAEPASVRLGETDELPLVTDPARLRVILRNLIANALQHGAPPVTVTLRPDEAGAVIEVTDQGMGVPSELRDTVFDRFVRGDRARQGTSNGLGLAIARENAHLLGGELVLAPDGRTFVLTLRGTHWELVPTAGQLDEPEPSGPTLSVATPR